MNRITKWIQERKMYSSPVFGLMLIINVMVFPVFQASARIVEPVQMMPQSAEEVVDALNAVEAGVTVDEAFGIQPLPFRDLIKTWKTAYLELFDIAFPAGGDAYFLDEEINLGDTGFLFEGATADGHVFSVDFIALIEADINSGSVPVEEQIALDSVLANPFGVIGTINTDVGTIHFLGTLAQWGVNESRVRELVIYEIVEQDFVDDYMGFSANFIEEPGDPIDSDSCSSCTESAQNSARLRMDIAKIALNSALASAALWMVGKGILCAATAAILLIGMAGAAGCIFRAALQSAATAAVATGTFNTARLISNAMLRADLEQCYIDNPGCRPV